MVKRVILFKHCLIIHVDLMVGEREMFEGCGWMGSLNERLGFVFMIWGDDKIIGVNNNEFR